MSSIVLPPDNIAVFKLRPLSNTGAVKPATGTITVDNYAFGYVAYNAGGQLVFVTKQIPGTNQHVNVTLTANGTNSNGDTLIPVTQVFQLDGPVDTDPATHFGFTEGPFVRDKIGYDVPPDGGQTIPLQ